MKVAAISGGCMCISNKLLMDKKVNFYPIIDYYNTEHAGEDFAYCVTARNNGYEVWVNDCFKICHNQVHKARPWRVNDKGEYIDFKYGE
jgi:GT2 family glycosyltransferase